MKNKTEIKITGQMKTSFTKVEKKFMQSVRIPTGDNYFMQVTTWVPNTPGYSKAPKVVLTLNNHREKIQILFPGALDLAEFTSVLNTFVEQQLKALHAAHTESMKDYQIFHELLLYQADQRAKEKAAAAFNNINDNKTQIDDYENL
jgi:hypothetical protein